MGERTGYCYPMHVIRWYFKHVIDDFAKEFRLKKECASVSVHVLCMYVCECRFGNELTRFFHTHPFFFDESFDPVHNLAYANSGKLERGNNSNARRHRHHHDCEAIVSVGACYWANCISVNMSC